MIQVPAQIYKVSTLLDGTIRLTLDLPELDSVSMAMMFDLRGKEVAITLGEKT